MIRVIKIIVYLSASFLLYSVIRQYWINNKCCQSKTNHIDRINQNTDFAISLENLRPKRSIAINSTNSYYQINNETKLENNSIRINKKEALLSNSSKALPINLVQNNNNSDHDDTFSGSSLRSNSSQIQNKPLIESFTNSVIDLVTPNTSDNIEDFTATGNKTHPMTKFLQTINDSTSVNDHFHKIISVMYHLLKNNNFFSTEAANKQDNDDKSSFDITTDSIDTDNSDDSTELSLKTKWKIHKIELFNTYFLTLMIIMGGVFVVVVITILSTMYYQSRKKRYHCWIVKNNRVLDHTTCL